MAQDIVIGDIAEIGEDGSVVIVAALPNLDRAILRKYSKVEIGFCDGRRISGEQRGKIYSLIGEIADWIGDYKSSVKEQMKWEFVLNRMDKMRKTMFSLSDVDMNTASEFISFLIDFMLEHDVPSRIPLTELCDDISKYVYGCLLNKRCSVCGRPGELHHLDHVGMGRDRQDINHIGLKAICLCREHHTQIHAKSQWQFLKDNHLQGVAIDEAIAKRYHLNKSTKQSTDVNKRGQGENNENGKD